MMSRVFLLAAACFLLLVSGSCDTSFNPTAAFQPRMVVYSILTTESDTQYVRVYSTYLPPNNDPTKNPDEASVTDAVVKITGTNPLYDARTYTFQSFDVKRADQERYKDSIQAYYSFPFRPIRGASYRLSVVSPAYGTATADLTLPTRGTIEFVDPLMLENPWTYPHDLQLSIKLSNLVDAFLVGLYVEYNVHNPQTDLWKPYRTEVPFKSVEISKALAVYDYTFPELTVRRTAKNSGPNSATTDGFSFQLEAYQTVIYRIVSQVDRSDFKRVVCYLIQVDEPLYRYYEEANLFDDKNSIRLDQPTYTNIQGGIGLFASMGVDSVVYPLPGGPICPPPPLDPNFICH